jgi:hypothetical protein
MFGALIVEFGWQREGEEEKKEINLRIIICCLKIVVKWIYK